MVGALFAAIWWLGSLAAVLFIIYHFYLLLKRLAIANERQATALDHIADNFRSQGSSAD